MPDRLRFPGILSAAFEHPTDRSALAGMRKAPGLDCVFRSNKYDGDWSDRERRHQMAERRHLMSTACQSPLRLFSFLLVLAGLSLPMIFHPSSAQADGMAPARLRCEYRINPLGIDFPQPRLSWIMQAPPQVRGAHQTAYHLLVASSPVLLAGDRGDVWDSGAVASRQTNHIAYAGKLLHSGQQLWWKVRIVDQAGQTSAWSAPGSWTMGILQQADWHGAEWIGAAQVPDPAPHGSDSLLLRRGFSVKPHLTRALAFVCGLGQYEMTVNGSKVSDHVLTPGWTLYTKTCLYDTYDLTRLLHSGANTAGLFLGNGMYNIHSGRYTKITGSFGPQRAICLLQLTYKDGTTEYVTTNKEWRTSPGPITFSSIYGGEDYDARLAPPGWNQAGFDESISSGTWSTPVVTPGPGGTLKGLSGAGPPIRSFAILTPLSHRQLSSDSAVYDLGRNASLMLRLKVEGPAGSSVKITPSELVHPSGDINDTMCGGDSYWHYTLSGRGIESYDSKFYYRGGRYLKVEAIPAPNSAVLPVVKFLGGDFIHADAPEVGRFSCSSELYNKVSALIRWAQLNNMVSILTDCPTREKLGWLEECHLNGPALRYNFDLAAMMTKTVSDMADSQRDTGLVPSTCPDYPQWGNDNPFANPPEWGSACIAVPWQQYQFEGDLELLRRSYPMMQRYVNYLSAQSKDDIVSFGLGDWYDNQQEGPSTLTPIGLTATAFYCYDTRTLAKVAALLGKTEDASLYTQQADAILSAYNRAFFHASANSYATGSQASNAFSLSMDMVHPADRPAVLKSLEDDLKAKGSTAGEVSLKYVLDSLAEAGQSDLIHSVYGSETSGYGLQVKQGKTSLAEAWNGGEDHSQDHFMFGQINEWFYRFLAGIQDDTSGPGFQKIIIRPALVHGLTSVSARYDSRQGVIESQWKESGSTVTLSVTIPANTTAAIYVPTRDVQSVRESGKPIIRGSGIVLLSHTQEAAVYAVGSGRYTFTAAINP